MFEMGQEDAVLQVELGRGEVENYMGRTKLAVTDFS